MGDTQQFEVFMRNHQNMVFSTAMRLVGDAAQAQDVSQEVFIRAYDRFDDLRDNPSAGGWLKTVATNLSLNHLARYRSRWSFFSELFSPRDSEDTTELDFPAEDQFAPQLLEQERSEFLDAALQKLPAAQRVPLVLFHLEGFSYEEIAAKLGVSLGKVKTDIFRGREALRKILQSKIETAREML